MIARNTMSMILSPSAEKAARWLNLIRISANTGNTINRRIEIKYTFLLGIGTQLMQKEMDFCKEKQDSNKNRNHIYIEDNLFPVIRSLLADNFFTVSPYKNELHAHEYTSI